MSVKVAGPAAATLKSLDPIWTRLRNEAEAVVRASRRLPASSTPTS